MKPQLPKAIRPLRQEERELVRMLTEQLPQADRILAEIDTLLVEDCNDGGMGSVKVARNGEYPKRQAIPIVQQLYVDDDGVQISAQIYTDGQGRLYEIDIWKTDFSPTKRYPCSATRSNKG